jgi:hypothetical protein
MRARKRTLFRDQSPIHQFDCAANQVETVKRCSDRRHGVGDQSNPVRAFCGERSPHRHWVDVDAIDNETCRQPRLRQRGTDNARGACAERWHRIEQMRDAGCALRDGLHDNGGGRLAVSDRNPHACRGKRHDKACRNAFGRQRHQRAAGSGKLAQLLQVARSRLHNPVGTVHTRAPRADERAFQMQA